LWPGSARNRQDRKIEAFILLVRQKCIHWQEKASLSTPHNNAVGPEAAVRVSAMGLRSAVSSDPGRSLVADFSKSPSTLVDSHGT
jgi:hypothetical protein